MIPLPDPTGSVPDPDVANASDAFVGTGDALYLDCAAHGPRLRRVRDAGVAAIESGALPWLPSFASWERQVETLRASVARVYFDGDADAVAMVPSAAYGIATAARNVALSRDDVVLVLEGQFPSNLLAWQQRCAESGATMLGVARTDDEDFSGTLCNVIERTARLRVVSVPNAFWRDGTRLDLDRIAACTHARGAALVLDLSQSLGAIPVDLARWQPDFVVSVGYKWTLGPMGLAWLWAAPRWCAEGIALEQHWSARDAGAQWQFDVTTPPPHRMGARRFDAGGITDSARLAMAQAAMDQMEAWTLPHVSDQLEQRINAFDDVLSQYGLDDWRTPRHAPHFTALRPPDRSFDAVVAAFARERIVCTQRHGLLRIAPHLHVGIDDMQRAARIAADAAAH